MQNRKQPTKVSPEAFDPLTTRMVGRTQAARLAGVGPDAIDAMAERGDIVLQRAPNGLLFMSPADVAKVMARYSLPRRG